LILYVYNPTTIASLVVVQESAMFDEFISSAIPVHHRTVDKSGNAQRQLPESLVEGQI